MATVPDNSFPFSLVGAERDRVRAVGALVQSWRAPLLARHGRQHQAGINQKGVATICKALIGAIEQEFG